MNAYTRRADQFAIKSGDSYVQSISPVTGRVEWTPNRDEAKGFCREEFAAELADGIGRVVVLDRPGTRA